jgi:hypothetical protein
MTSQAKSSFTDLPYEPESASELLSSTHLFETEILSLDATPFVVGDDALEHRRLLMELRLLKLFKGTLDIRPNQTFHLEVEQCRESEFFVTDYHGIWSHLEPDVHIRYIVVASTELTSPALLMQEGSLQKLLDISYESDVRLGLEAEQIYQTKLAEAKENSLLIAAGALLKLTQDNQTTAKDVFGRYLWARVGTVFLDTPQRLLPDLLQLILAEDATIELRRSLVQDLYAAILLLEPNLDILRAVLGAFFALLRQESARPLYDTLVDAQIYNLVFEEGKPRFGARMVIPNSSERNALKAIVSRFGSDRAQRLAGWLDGTV